MKTKLVLKELKEALKMLNDLNDKINGEPSDCGVEELKEVPLYIESWVKYPIEEAIKEIERVV